MEATQLYLNFGDVLAEFECTDGPIHVCPHASKSAYVITIKYLRRSVDVYLYAINNNLVLRYGLGTTERVREQDYYRGSIRPIGNPRTLHEHLHNLLIRFMEDRDNELFPPEK